MASARIDHLNLRQQMILKVCAVFDDEFDVPGLVRLCTSAAFLKFGTEETLKSTVLKELRVLCDAGLVAKSSIDTPDGVLQTFQISHRQVKDAAYELLPFKLRKNLHSSLAKSLCASGSPDRLIAHHYLKAEEWSDAVTYLERTCMHDLKFVKAYSAASLGFLELLHIIQLHPSARALVGPLQIGTWHLGLAVAQHELGNRAAAEAQYQLAKTMLTSGSLRFRDGQPVLTIETLLQVVHMLLPAFVWSSSRSKERHERDSQLVQLYSRSAQINLAAGKTRAAVQDALLAVNIGDHLEACPEYPRACTMMMSLPFWMHSHKWGRVACHYVERARSLVGESSTSGTSLSFVHLSAGNVAIIMGNLELARKSFMQGSEIGLADCEHRNRDFCEGSIAMLCLLQGDLESAHNHVSTMLRSASERGDLDRCKFGHAIKAMLLLADDKQNAALSLLEQNRLLDDYSGIALFAVHCSGNSVAESLEDIHDAISKFSSQFLWLDWLKLVPASEALVREWADKIVWQQDAEELKVPAPCHVCDRTGLAPAASAPASAPGLRRATTAQCAACPPAATAHYHT